MLTRMITVLVVALFAGGCATTQQEETPMGSLAESPAEPPAEATITPEETTPAAREILLGARKALRDYRDVRFDMTEEYMLDDEVQRITQAAVLLDRDADETSPARFALTIGQSTGRRTTTTQAVHDGTMIRSIDDEKKQVRVAEADRRLISSFTSPVRRFLRIYTDEDPLKRELDVQELSYEGIEVVGGVECDAILANHGGTRRATWYVGQEDSLIRGVTYATRNTRDQAVTIDIRTTGFEVDDDLPADAFAVETPEGYTVAELTPPRPAGRASSSLLESGAAAPAFAIMDGDGRKRSLADYRGKIVVLDFWATWCAPCKRVMPKLQKLHDDYADRGVVVIGISCKERPGGDPKGYMDKQGYTYGLLVDGNAAADAYGASAIPTLYVIDGEGKVIHSHRGANQSLFDEMVAVIAATLGE
jgi:peroxiredoxin